MIFTVSACTGLRNSDDVSDGGIDAVVLPDAGEGDPLLARSPKSRCSTPMLDSDVGAILPGYAKSRHPSAENAKLTTNLYRCPIDNVIEMAIENTDPLVVTPAMGIRNGSVGKPFVLQYVLESIEVKNENKSTLAGFLVHGSDASENSTVFFERDVATNIFLIRRSDNEPAVLAAFQLPFRIRFEGDPQSTSPNRLVWKLTIRDRSKTATYQGSYVIPTLSNEVLIGINLGTTSASSRLAISDLILQ
jgi:hypothetical protein